ncbi:hypothetical protein WI664_03095, partial [Vibrio cholerae]
VETMLIARKPKPMVRASVSRLRYQIAPYLCLTAATKNKKLAQLERVLLSAAKPKRQLCHGEIRIIFIH